MKSLFIRDCTESGLWKTFSDIGIFVEKTLFCQDIVFLIETVLIFCYGKTARQKNFRGKKRSLDKVNASLSK